MLCYVYKMKGNQLNGTCLSSWWFDENARNFITQGCWSLHFNHPDILRNTSRVIFHLIGMLKCQNFIFTLISTQKVICTKQLSIKCQRQLEEECPWAEGIISHNETRLIGLSYTVKNNDSFGQQTTKKCWAFWRKQVLCWWSPIFVRLLSKVDQNLQLRTKCSQ